LPATTSSATASTNCSGAGPRPDRDRAAAGRLSGRPWLGKLPGARPGEAWLAAAGRHHVSCGIVWRDGATVIGLEHLRRADRPPFGRRHLVMHELFLPHLRRAWELFRLLRGEQAEGAAGLAAALREVPAAVVLADADGRVVAASEAAQRAVVVDAAGEGDALPAAIAGASPLLHGAVLRAAGAARNGDPAPRQQVALHHLPGGERVSAGIVPLPSAAQAEVAVVLEPRDEEALARARWRQSVMTTPYFAKANEAQRLRLLYGLTPAEARLAQLLAAGRCLDEAARQLGVGRSTVRTHLQRIFDKTGTCCPATGSTSCSPAGSTGATIWSPMSSSRTSWSAPSTRPATSSGRSPRWPRR
jgi:DNA-binding CsgD family transcriptional regulator/PAS domain-containing protein